MGKIFFFILAVLISSCGGGGSGGGDGGGQLGDDLFAGVYPEGWDIFEKVSYEYSVQEGRKFDHIYYYSSLNSGLESSVVGFTCENPFSAYEYDLRPNAERITPRRFCIEASDRYECFYLGARSIRREIEYESAVYNIIRIRGALYGDISYFEVAANKEGGEHYNLLIHSAWSDEPSCTDSSEAMISPSDIVGDWDVVIYTLGSEGAPDIEEITEMTCSLSGCFNDSGAVFSEISEDDEVSSSGMYYSGYFSYGEYFYQNSRAILSKTKNMLSIYACPVGIEFSDQVFHCRFVIAERR